MFSVDDLCLMAPCTIALQQLLNICHSYSIIASLNFNAQKLFCFAFTPRLFKLSLPFLVVFSFFEKTTYCCRARRLSVRLSVRPSVRLSVRPSVEIISFCGNSLPNRPIELKIGLNVREGVVHVRKA